MLNQILEDSSFSLWHESKCLHHRHQGQHYMKVAHKYLNKPGCLSYFGQRCWNLPCLCSMICAELSWAGVMFLWTPVSRQLKSTAVIGRAQTVSVSLSLCDLCVWKEPEIFLKNTHTQALKTQGDELSRLQCGRKWGR